MYCTPDAQSRLARRAGMQMPRHQLLGIGSNRGIIAKSREPMHERFFTKPGELALGVVARGLGNCFLCGSEGDGAFEVRAQFAVPDKIERLRGKRNPLAREAGNLFEP